MLKIWATHGKLPIWECSKRPNLARVPLVISRGTSRCFSGVSTALCLGSGLSSTRPSWGGSRYRGEDLHAQLSTGPVQSLWGFYWKTAQYCRASENAGCALDSRKELLASPQECYSPSPGIQAGTPASCLVSTEAEAKMCAKWDGEQGRKEGRKGHRRKEVEKGRRKKKGARRQ